MEDERQFSDGLREVSASEILAKIEKGEPVEYDRVTIKGDLDVGMLNQKVDAEKNIMRIPINLYF